MCVNGVVWDGEKGSDNRLLKSLAVIRIVAWEMANSSLRSQYLPFSLQNLPAGGHYSGE